MTHTSTEQPEALRLADKYEIEGFLQDHRFAKDHWCRQAAVELRRQHARIAELEAQLSATPPAQEGWCDGCSPDNCCGCGPAAPAKVQPEPSTRESGHE